MAVDLSTAGLTADTLPASAALALAAERANHGADAFIGIRLPHDLDARLTLRRPYDFDVSASYERPSRGFALIGVGTSARVTLPPRGPASEGAASEVDAALGWLGRPAVAADAALRPRLLVAMAFDDERSPRGPWEGWDCGQLLLPRLLFVRDGGVSGVVVAPGVQPAELDATLRALTASAEHTPRHAPIEWRVARELHRPHLEASMAAVAAEIRAGVYDKAVLAGSRELEASGPIDLGAAVERLRTQYPHCHLFTVTCDGATFLGASPELLVSLHEGQVLALGLAGSAPRGENEVEDQQYGEALLGSAKDRIEHAIVVQAIREGLAPLTEALRAPNQPRLLQLRNIQHLATEITGRARAEVDILTLVRGLHPTPAVCGWPTEAARRVILSHEDFERGWYAGPVGWVDAAGDGEFAVGLRSALVRGTRAWLFAGAGIIGDSRPESELAEIALKFRPLAGALAGGAV